MEFSKGCKRKHTNLTIMTKIEILKELDKGSSAKYLSETFGISVRTVYDIKSNKAKLLDFYQKSDCNKAIANRKRIRDAKSADLDAILFEWFKQRRVENVPITGPILCHKAKELHKELKIEEKCDFTTGWLTKFKRRHGIRYIKACGEKVSADKLAAEEFVEEFERIIQDEKLSPEQIYNMDETGLFWCNLPRQTYVAETEKEISSVKDDKRRLTVLVCANAAGTHKCKLLVVGKSAHPRPLKGVKILPVVYKNNKRAWMTQEIANDWFKSNFLPEAREHCSKAGLPQDCKILILMDNCRAHPEFVAPNVLSLFLPPNTTSLIQPMDQGIINSMKCHYKSEFVKKLLNHGSSINSISDLKIFFNIKDALYMLKEAWESVTQDTLIKSWHNLWPLSLFIETEADEKEFAGFKTLAKIKAAELLTYAKNFQSTKLSADTIEEFLSTDEDPPAVMYMTDQEIISSVISPEDTNNSDTDSDIGETEKRISIDEGIALGNEYLKFLEAQKCVTKQEVLTVYRLQQKLVKEKPKLLKQTTLDSMFKKKPFP